MNKLTEQISSIGVVPVIKLNNPERDAANLAKALCAGGIPAAEVTFRAAGADKAMATMLETCPDMLVGAGTVLTVEQVKQAHAAGAKFIVSPGFDAKIVEATLALDMLPLPGCTTATAIQMALAYDLEVLKFFPAAQSGGLSMIEALHAPFSMVKFMPTGGISLSNLAEFISSPAIVACGGTYMVKDALIEGGKWDEITDLCKKSVDIVKAARNG